MQPLPSFRWNHDIIGLVLLALGETVDPTLFEKLTHGDPAPPPSFSIRTAKHVIRAASLSSEWLVPARRMVFSHMTLSPGCAMDLNILIMESSSPCTLVSFVKSVTLMINLGLRKRDEWADCLPPWLDIPRPVWHAKLGINQELLFSKVFSLLPQVTALAFATRHPIRRPLKLSAMLGGTYLHRPLTSLTFKGFTYDPDDLAYVVSRFPLQELYLIDGTRQSILTTPTSLPPQTLHTLHIQTANNTVILAWLLTASPPLHITTMHEKESSVNPIYDPRNLSNAMVKTWGYALRDACFQHPFWTGNLKVYTLIHLFCLM